MTRSEPTRQRDRLQFYKAFFEVRDLESTHALLDAAGAIRLDDGLSERDGWYVWRESEQSTAAPQARFLLRIRSPRLVLEGPSAESVGRGWRELDRHLGAAAEARVAAGDDLSRFLPRKRKHSADRPESWSREYQNRVLEEFYSVFRSRWSTTPHPRLDGRTPREAAEIPELHEALEALLSRMESVERERRDRDLPAVDVGELRSDLGLRSGEESS